MSTQNCGCDFEALVPAYCERYPECQIPVSTWRGERLLSDQTPAVSKAVAASGASSTEVRVVDPVTGGEKGQKLERFDLIPVEFETELARHYGRGARKYEDRNWEKGYRWSLSIAALRRHLAAWLDGETNDPETGTNHLICCAWHCIALFIFQIRGLGTDDIRRSS